MELLAVAPMTVNLYMLYVRKPLASPGFAQKDQLPSDADLAAITARGRLLYEYDEAAWHATDALLATNPPKESVGRCIAQKTDAGWVVAFGHLNKTRDAFLIADLATQGQAAKTFTIKRIDPAQSDTGYFLTAARGMDTVSPDFHGANRTYNIAVLPALAGQLYIYLVPGGTDSDLYPLGADARYLVSADGATIVEKRQLHKGIIPTGGPLPADAKAEGGYHTHVLSDIPEDTDVFHVLTRKPSIPEYIGTQPAIYVVNIDGTIRIVERMKKHR